MQTSLKPHTSQEPTLTTNPNFSPEREMKQNLMNMYLKTIQEREDAKQEHRRKQLIEERNYLNSLHQRIKEEDLKQREREQESKNRIFSEYQTSLNSLEDAKTWTKKYKRLKNEPVLSDKISKHYDIDAFTSQQSENFYINNNSSCDNHKFHKRMFMDKYPKTDLLGQREPQNFNDQQTKYRNELDSQLNLKGVYYNMHGVNDQASQTKNPYVDPYHRRLYYLGGSTLKNNPIIDPKNSFDEKRFKRYIEFINEDSNRLLQSGSITGRAINNYQNPDLSRSIDNIYNTRNTNNMPNTHQNHNTSNIQNENTLPQIPQQCYNPSNSIQARQNLRYT